MRNCSFTTVLGEHLARPWLVVLLWTSVAIGLAGKEPGESDAEVWRNQRLETIDRQIQDSQSKDERREYAARQSWLRRWKPGQMPSTPAHPSLESELVEEPRLETLKRPPEVSAKVWQQMNTLQTRLLAIDTDDLRKENLSQIIDLAKELETKLSEQLSSESQQLPTPTGWALAFTRYRVGRALAYRELPVVRERWPIADAARYEIQLGDAYQRLITQTGRGRPEFILLEDRMLRRSGKKGQALELLEANRQSIEQKWYLKKRRDLLQELGWERAYQEAARLYKEAGYDDKP